MSDKSVLHLRPRQRRPAEVAYLTLDQAAERAQVSKRTVERWMRDDGCPYIKLPGGHLVRIPVERFDAWLDQER